MRILPALLLLAAVAQAAHAAEPPSAPSWPLWDGSESIEQYAKKANLEAARTLDLGNGVKLEMVLIPAGKFVMGTPEPEAVDEEGFRRKILVGQVALAVGGGALLAMLAVVLTRAIRRRQRPQYSLAYLVVMVVVAGVGVLGGTHWWEAARMLAEAKAEYQAAMARFKAGDDREKPAHEVTLTRPYYLGKFEVTQEQYQQVMGGNPSDFKGQNLPVENVSCGDAQEFCKKASERAGVVVRLPTEAEWEYTCRAGTRTNYYTGDSDADLERAAWHHWNSDGKIHPVGQKSPNPWGLYDMHGNVWEWCADQYGDYTGRKEAGPQDPAQGQSRVVRGGSSEELTGACRSAARTERMPNARSRFLGFRVAAEVPSRAP